MAPSVAPIEMSDAWSVGRIPRGPVEGRPPGRSANPHWRQTCAHEGLAWPQLKHSTVSPLIGPEPSTQVAAGGENADGQWTAAQPAVRG